MPRLICRQLHDATQAAASLTSPAAAIGSALGFGARISPTVRST